MAEGSWILRIRWYGPGCRVAYARATCWGVPVRQIVLLVGAIAVVVAGCSAGSEPGPLPEPFAGSWVYDLLNDEPVLESIPLEVRVDRLTFDVEAPCNDFTFAFIEDTGGEFTIGEWWQTAAGCDDDNDLFYTSFFVDNDEIAYEFTEDGLTLAGGQSTLTLIRP